MPSYEHKKLIGLMARIDTPPSDPLIFSKWIEAGQHLDLLRTNADSNEVIVHGTGEYIFVHSMIVPNEQLSPLNQDDLLSWNCNPYTSIAGYAYGGGREKMWIDRGKHNGSKTLDAGMDLIFGRTFEGWSGDDRTYFEVNQEYTHLAGIHWRPEHRSYCKFDDNGDLEYIVSVTRGSGSPDVSLISFSWETLENYLAVSGTSLVRMFDFTLLRRDSFSGWPNGPENIHRISDDFFYRQKIAGNAAYTRGVQIIRPRRPALEIMSDIKNGWHGRRNKQYVEFIAQDWRNNQVTRISTDPQATTNYFEADKNTLPFELSPAFFRPEVLSKYKTDREKYTVGEREIRCRAAWGLRGFDINEAGQIHAYICDLQKLPYAEQLHWLSFNEEPKATISERAFVNDFKGEFVNFMHPLQKVLGIARRWHKDRVAWWTLRNENLLDSISKPVTASRDEWGESFMDLSKLIIEGFELKAIREKLDNLVVAYDQKEQSIALLEKLVGNSHKGGSAQLVGLRVTQHIRTKVKGHAGNTEAKQIAQEVISKHETFAEHFKHVCGIVITELEIIERSF